MGDFYDVEPLRIVNHDILNVKKCQFYHAIRKLGTADIERVYETSKNDPTRTGIHTVYLLYFMF